MTVNSTFRWLSEGVPTRCSRWVGHPLAGTVNVAADGCPTQRLHLVGTLIESQQKVELTVNAVRLQRRAGL